ncbi:MATE family efflux transporter [Megalodesulfovibrio paquesii]
MSCSAFSRRWNEPNGYRDVLHISLPMIASMGAQTVMLTTDRYFLARHSLEAIAASWPAGMANFAFMALFMGTAQYINIFIAQYVGSEAPARVGAAIWQGLWFSLAAGLCMALTALLAEPIFSLAGHEPVVLQLEVDYFQVLSVGAVFGLVQNTLACFYSGQGLTRPVMYVNGIGALVNVPLDYCLIFGWGPFPAWGVAGAAVATITGAAISAGLFAWLVFSRENERRFGTRARWRLDRELMSRFLRYGAPGGLQFGTEILAFTVFLFLAGRLGTEALAATNMAISINTVGFLPMVGMHIALCTMVGQAIGGGSPAMARKAIGSGLHLALSWCALTVVLYLLFPEPLIRLFLDPASPEAAAVEHLGVVLMRFVAAYAFFDAMILVYFAALKGAGDTHYIMRAIIVVALTVMIVPGIVMVEWLDGNIYALWCLLTAYVAILGVGGLLRYRGGKWQHMRVVETAAKP